MGSVQAICRNASAFHFWVSSRFTADSCLYKEAQRRSYISCVTEGRIRGFYVTPKFTPLGGGFQMFLVDSLLSFLVISSFHFKLCFLFFASCSPVCPSAVVTGGTTAQDAETKRKTIS